MSENKWPEKGDVRDIWIPNEWTVEYVPGARHTGLQWTGKVGGRNRRWMTHEAAYSLEECVGRLIKEAEHYEARAARIRLTAENLLRDVSR